MTAVHRTIEIVWCILEKFKKKVQFTQKVPSPSFCYLKRQTELAIVE